MRKIAIIGAGQAGLLLAMGLLAQGYRVTVVADRSPDEILHGPVPAGAVVFDDALSVERDLGVHFWGETAVKIEALHLDLVGPNAAVALTFEAALDRPALCIDQRLKSARWLQEVERRGGNIVVKPATIEDLERYTAEYDLVVVAAGKGEIASLFPRDEVRSPIKEPPRHISMVVVKGLLHFPSFNRPGVKFNILPGLGEIFSAPFFGKDELQGSFLGIEAIPGSPLDRFTPGMDPEVQLAFTKAVFRDFLPWDYEAIRDAQLLDRRANLCGKFVPAVRSPVGRLPSGAIVLGIADAVNLHDPLAAQGANNAAKAARIFTRRIIDHAAAPFDANWMHEGFEEVWAGAQYANQLCEKLLAPPEPHAVEILATAARVPQVAHRFVNGFANPPDLFPWFVDATEAKKYLQSVGA